MKSRLLTGFAGALLAVTGAGRAVAQPEQPIVVPLSDPSRPAMLEVSLFNGSISVIADDGDEVVILTHDRSAEAQPPVDENGLHRVPNTSIGLTAEERDNTVSIASDWIGRAVDLEIMVPRRTSVHARAVNSGELRVEGVAGDHELSNVNGSIAAVDISGSAVVGTTNGNVEVSFKELTPGKAMSFTSFNGNVEVTFPGDLAADLRMNSARGEVLTDFDFDVEPQTPVVERGADGDRYRVRLERDVRAAVGGGGPELQFKTFNGNIVIRHR